VDRHGHIGAMRLTAQAVVLVLKLHAARTGLDPKQAAGHSLRASHATSTLLPASPSRRTTGTAIRRPYIREDSLFREKAAGAVGP